MVKKEHPLQQAKALVQERRFQEALAAYKQIVEASPEDRAIANADMAFVHCELGEPQVAVDFANRAIAEDPEMAEAHATLGLAYFRVGREKDAIEHLKKAIRLNPKEARARTTLGVVYYRRRELDAAAESLRSAVSIDERLPEANYNLALVLIAQAEEKKAKLGDPAEDRREARKYLRAFLKQRAGNEQRDADARKYLRELKAAMEADGGLTVDGAR